MALLAFLQVLLDALSFPHRTRLSESLSTLPEEGCSPCSGMMRVCVSVSLCISYVFLPGCNATDFFRHQGDWTRSNIPADIDAGTPDVTSW